MSIVATRRTFVAGAAILALAGHASAQMLREVTIALSSASFANAAPRIADAMGMFQKRGIQPKFIVMDSANAAAAALIAGSVQVASAGMAELLFAQTHGQKVIAIANVYAGSSGTMVLANSVVEKLGVSPDAPMMTKLKALDGLTIAGPSATSAYVLSYRNAALSAGANIHFTYMSQPAMVAALSSGAVQGYIGGAPFWAIPVIKGYGTRWLSGPKGELPPACLPATTQIFLMLRSTIDANRDLVKNLAAVFIELGHAVIDRPAEVKAVIGKLYPDMDATMLDLLFATESAAWKPQPISLEGVKHDIAFVKSDASAPPGIDSFDPASLFFTP